MLRIHYWSQFRSRQIISERRTIETSYQRLKDKKKSKPISQLLKKFDKVNMVYNDVLEWQVDLLPFLAQIKGKNFCC